MTRKVYSKDDWGNFCRDIDRQRSKQILSTEDFIKRLMNIKWIKINIKEKSVEYGYIKSQRRNVQKSTDQILLRSVYYFSKQKFPLKLKDGNSVSVFFAH